MTIVTSFLCLLPGVAVLLRAPPLLQGMTSFTVRPDIEQIHMVYHDHIVNFIPYDRASLKRHAKWRKQDMQSKKVALITGAAGALGSATAATFKKAGYRLSLLDMNIKPLQERWEGKEHVTCLPCDLTDAGNIEDAVDKTVRMYGSIDTLLTIAGGFAMGPQIHELTEEEWDSMQNMNLRTVFLAARAVIPHMRKQQSGSIVTIGAQTALHGAANLAPYVVSKSSVIRLTECMAQENKTEGIRVNCILPSVIDTPANRADMPDADFSKWTKPEAIADVLLFLASDASKAVNGASIPV